MKQKKIKIFVIIYLSFITSIFGIELSDGKIQARLNILNGNSSECLMHEFYTNSGWINIEGEVGRNGIDGLYYKVQNGTIKEVLVSESKWNKSRLGRSGKNKLIKQMSKRWIIRVLNRLQKYRPLPEYSTIQKFIENNQYRARLFKVFPKDKDKIQIVIYRLKNKGDNEFDKIKVNKLKPISIETQKNTFEIAMIKAYKKCKKEAINKYFGSVYIKGRQIIFLLETTPNSSSGVIDLRVSSRRIQPK